MQHPITDEELKGIIGKEDPVIINIGCYDGKDSIRLADLFESPRIFAFEADPRSAATFRRVVGDDPRIILIEKAVCHLDGETVWWASESRERRHHDFEVSYSASSSINPPKTTLELFEDIQYAYAGTVPATRLDTWAEEAEDIKTIDLIWADVNGAERELIEGAYNTLVGKTRYLFTEFSDLELFEGQPTKEEILQLLGGFKEIGIYDFLGNFGNILLENQKLVKPCESPSSSPT